MFNTHELSEIKKLLNPQNKIVIITHYNPDGDGTKTLFKCQRNRCRSGCPK